MAAPDKRLSAGFDEFLCKFPQPGRFDVMRRWQARVRMPESRAPNRRACYGRRIFEVGMDRRDGCCYRQCAGRLFDLARTEQSGRSASFEAGPNLRLKASVEHP